MITSGLPRLPDEPLVDKIHLTVKLLDRGRRGDLCADREGDRVGHVADAEALLKGLEALDVDSIGRWYDINIQAIEAEAASTPARAVDPAEAERVLGGMIGAFSEAEAAQLGALYGTGPVPATPTPAAACAPYTAISRSCRPPTSPSPRGTTSRPDRPPAAEWYSRDSAFGAG